MKLLAGIISTLVLGQALLLADASVGKAAPDFTVQDVNGKTHKLSDYKGKIVVLENYNLDCPFVANLYTKDGVPALQADATKAGVIWLTVNSNYKDEKRARKELSKVKATALIHDPEGKIGKTYGFKTTPHLIVVDKTGQVAYNGAIDDKPDADHNPKEARNYVREALDKLQAGQPVAVASTKPYGCGAKYAR